jgi:hypothetical protein
MSDHVFDYETESADGKFESLDTAGEIPSTASFATMMSRTPRPAQFPEVAPFVEGAIPTMGLSWSEIKDKILESLTGMSDDVYVSLSQMVSGRITTWWASDTSPRAGLEVLTTTVEDIRNTLVSTINTQVDPRFNGLNTLLNARPTVDQLTTALAERDAIIADMRVELDELRANHVKYYAHAAEIYDAFRADNTITEDPQLAVARAEIDRLTQALAARPATATTTTATQQPQRPTAASRRVNMSPARTIAEFRARFAPPLELAAAAARFASGER